MQNKQILLIAFGLFVLSALVSYFVFQKTFIAATVEQTKTTTSQQTNDFGAITFDQTKPKTEACPLNGAKYSQDQKKWWEAHRPLGIMIENHVDARPQSGISFADVTYEAVAEGGITRTLNFFYCQDAGIVGPVRSARTYFIDFASEYGDSPLYTHVGGANTPGPADALGQINDYGWAGYNDINQFSVGFPTFKRDETRAGHPVATEHTMYSTTSQLWDVAKQRGLTNVGKDGTPWDKGFVQYSFKDDTLGAISQTVHVEFWGDSEYNVDWIYDKNTNSYLRKNGGQPHIDRNTGKQLSVKDVIVLQMVESHANDGYENNQHLLYRDKGTGKAFIFMDGKEIKGTWSKAGRTARTIITDGSGQEVKFTRGHLWFEIIPTTGTITAQ